MCKSLGIILFLFNVYKDEDEGTDTDYELDDIMDSHSSSSESECSKYDEDEWPGLDNPEEEEESKEILISSELLPAAQENSRCLIHMRNEMSLPPIPATRYVPPHLRNKENANERSSESMTRLSRQLKGLLNR